MPRYCLFSIADLRCELQLRFDFCYPSVLANSLSLYLNYSRMSANFILTAAGDIAIKKNQENLIVSCKIDFFGINLYEKN